MVLKKWPVVKCFKEGDKCLACNQGTLEIVPPANCTCFVKAPCRECSKHYLTCNHCGWCTDD